MTFMVAARRQRAKRRLYDTFQDETIGDSSARLVIPAFLSPKTQIAVLKTDHHEDFQKDHVMAAWEAARATSAAPTFFQGHAVPIVKPIRWQLIENRAMLLLDV